MQRLTFPRLLATAGAVVSAIAATAGPTAPAGAETSGCVVDLGDALGWWKGEDVLVAEIGPDLTGSVGFTDAHVARGMAFDHGDDASTAALPTITDGLTLEAWIKPETTGFTQTLFSRWDFFGHPSDNSYALLLTASDLILYNDELSTLYPATLSASAPQLFDGDFHHVAATWGDGQTALYIDGVAVATGPSQPGPLNAAGSMPFRLGSASGPGRLPFTGVLDEATVFGRALSAAEIEAIVASGPDGKCPTGWHQQAKLNPGDPVASAQHGFSVAVDGDTAVVGAPVVGSGAAYVYTRTNGVWTQQATLTPPDGGGGDQFGASVAVSGDTIAVGAYLDDDAGSSSGSAYVFTRSGTTWTPQAKLTASDAAAGDWFGTGVAVDGDTTVVGAMFDGGTGSAYAFVRSGSSWSEQGKLVAANAVSGDRFGFDVDVDGDTVVAGAHRDDGAAADTGSAYVFTRSAGTWSQEAKLVAADAAAEDFFGYSVAVDGDRVVAGAYRDDDGGLDSGSAYVFVRSGTAWSQEAKLIADDAVAFDALGATVDIAGNTILTGASLDDDGGSDSGAGYVFTHDGGAWVQQVKLVANDPAPADWFGAAVAVDAGTAVIGAPLDDDGANATGSAYVFAFVA